MQGRRGRNQGSSYFIDSSETNVVGVLERAHSNDVELHEAAFDLLRHPTHRKAFESTFSDAEVTFGQFVFGGGRQDCAKTAAAHLNITLRIPYLEPEQATFVVYFRNQHLRFADSALRRDRSRTEDSK